MAFFRTGSLESLIERCTRVGIPPMMSNYRHLLAFQIDRVKQKSGTRNSPFLEL